MAGLTYLLLAALAALSATSTRASPPDFHTLPSGRQIPLSAITSHPHAATGKHMLYELTADGKLSSSAGLAASLHSVKSSRPLQQHAEMRVTLNGKALSGADAHAGATLRSGPGFSAVYAPGDKLPAAVHLAGKGLYLAPLHFDDHPGVYIAAPNSDDGAADLRTSEDTVARTAVRDPSISMEGGKDNQEIEVEGESSDRSGDGDVNSATNEGKEAKGKPISDQTVTNTGRALLQKNQLGGATPGERDVNVLTEEADAQLPVTTTRQVRWCGVRAAKRYYEVAAAFDNMFCARYGNNYIRAIAAIQTNMNAANAAFWSDTCLLTALVHVDAHCQDAKDPYAAPRGKSSSIALAYFATLWQRNAGLIQRDIAVLFVGYWWPDALNVNGLLDSSCSKQKGYLISRVLTPGALALKLAASLGARPPFFRSSSGLRLSLTAATQVRNFLQTNPKSWCITSARRSCPAGCPSGRCVAGKCVTGSVVVAPSGGKTCGSNLVRNRPFSCMLGLPVVRYVTPWLDILRISTAVQYGNVVVRVQVIVGSVRVKVGFRVGAVPTTFQDAAVKPAADTLLFRTSLNGLASPGAGVSCCWKKMYYTVRVYGCLNGICGIRYLQLRFNLQCKQVCIGSGTPLPMGPAQCQRCQL